MDRIAALVSGLRKDWCLPLHNALQLNKNRVFWIGQVKNSTAKPSLLSHLTHALRIMLFLPVVNGMLMVTMSPEEN